MNARAAWAAYERKRSKLAHWMQTVSLYPDAWHGAALKRFEFVEKWQGESAANLCALNERDKLTTAQKSLMTASDDDLQSIAEQCAKAIGRMVSAASAELGSAAIIVGEGEARARQYGVQLPPATLSTSEALRRYEAVEWWRHGLRKARARAIEAAARELGHVGRHVAPYVSDEGLRLRRAARRRNDELIRAMELVNETTGEVMSMDDVVASSLANPANRMAELVIRVRGYEDIAKERGDCGLFITLTCPSKYHARTKTGGRNRKWTGANPREAQKYLCDVWARIRAELGRENVRVYGLRVAEPHHDGTPHWHLCLFVEQARADWVQGVMRGHAMREDGNERGAAENRIKIVQLDPAKGSATGYVVKYISKNLGGIAGEQDEETGAGSMQVAERVEAWASLWGIRQFQTFGGHYIGTWRELRRVPELDGNEPDPIRDAHDAVNVNEEEGRKPDFAAFVRALGGIETAARDALVSVAVEVEERLGRYGMALFIRPVGVVSGPCLVKSERSRWQVRRKHNP